MNTFYKTSISNACAKVHSILSLEAEAPELLRFSETDEIDGCPEKITLNELSANSFAFIFRYSASISDNSGSVTDVLFCDTKFLIRRTENQ